MFTFISLLTTRDTEASVVSLEGLDVTHSRFKLMLNRLQPLFERHLDICPCSKKHDLLYLLYADHYVSPGRASCTAPSQEEVSHLSCSLCIQPVSANQALNQLCKPTIQSQES